MKIYLVLAWALFWLFATPALGQEQSAQNEPQSVRRLIEVLQDDQLRTQLFGHLRTTYPETNGPPTSGTEHTDSEAVATAPLDDAEETSGFIGVILSWFSHMLESLPTMTFGVPLEDMFQEASNEVHRRLTFGLESGELAGWALWAVPAVLLATFTCSALMGLVETRAGAKGRRSIKGLATSITLQIISIVTIFVIAAFMIWVLSPPKVSGGYFLAMCAGVLSTLAGTSMILTSISYLEQIRSIRLIRYCRLRFKPWLLGILTLAVAALFFNSTESQQVTGKVVAEVANFTFNTLAAVSTFIFCHRQRRAIGKLVFGKRLYDSGSGAPVQLAVHQLARHWHLFAYAFLLLSLFSLIAGSQSNSVLGQAASSFGVVLTALTAAALVRAFLTRSEKRRRRVRPTVRAAMTWGVLVLLGHALNASLVLGVIVTVAGIWRLDVLPWVMANGQQLISPIVAAATCAAIAWLVWIAVDTWINGVLNPVDAFGRFRQRSNRAQTLLPLARTGLLILILVVAAMAILTNLGVNVTPLIAGAGVFGIALSFGSQQLVQDVITGLFILAEDTIAIGETINTGDRTGVVEGLSLRTVRLRDADGALHSVPFSTIKALKNSSRNYSVFRPKFSVPAGVKPEDVLGSMRDTVSLLQGDVRYSAAITGDLHNLGIEELTTGSVIVSGSLRTIPQRQSELARAFNGVMLESLRAKGITL